MEMMELIYGSFDMESYFCGFMEMRMVEMGFINWLMGIDFCGLSEEEFEFFVEDVAYV